jgi:iron complex transport system substrate-binding protein
MRAGRKVNRRAALLVGAAIVAGGCRAGGRAPSRPASPRVVSLHDVTTEIVVAVGAGGRLVGVGEPVDLDGATRAAIARVPRVEGAESILAARPTLVLGTAVVAERSPELVALLRARGIEVWLAHPSGLEDVLAAVREVGSRVDATAAAEGIVERLRSRMSATADAGCEPLRVFVYDCCDPAFTAGAGSVLTDIIRRAGGRNVFADVATDWTKVSWEEVIGRRPQLIVIHDYAYEGQGDVSEKRRQLARLRSLAGVPVAVIPLRYSLGGLPSFEGLEELRRAIGLHRSAG